MRPLLSSNRLQAKSRLVSCTWDASDYSNFLPVAVYALHQPQHFLILSFITADIILNYLYYLFIEWT